MIGIQLELLVEMLNKLNKDDLRQYVSYHVNHKRMSKRALVDVMIEEIKEGKVCLKDLLSHEKLLIGPVEVEEYLCITRVQRKRWQKDGRLEVESCQ